jgi:hypothetical protein
VTETKYPLLSEVRRELGNLRANLEHWKDFMNGLFGFSFLLCISYWVKSRCGERNILCLLLILIIGWGMSIAKRSPMGS